MPAIPACSVASHPVNECNGAVIPCSPGIFIRQGPANHLHYSNQMQSLERCKDLSSLPAALPEKEKVSANLVLFFASCHPSTSKGFISLRLDCWGPPRINMKPEDGKRWSDGNHRSRRLKDLFIPPGDRPDMLIETISVSARAISNH